MSSLTKKSLQKESSAPRRYQEADRVQFFEVLDRPGNVRASSAELGSLPGSAANVSRSRPKTQYTQAQKDGFFSAFDRLGSISAPAREAGINTNTCFQWVYKAGIKPKQRAVDRRTEFGLLRAAGRTQRDAVMAVGIRPRTAPDWGTGVRRFAEPVISAFTRTGGLWTTNRE